MRFGLRYLVCWVLLLALFFLNAIGLDVPSCPVIISLGELYLLSDNPSSVFYQPAGIFQGIAISHSALYGFDDLNLINIASQFTIFNEIVSFGCFVLDNNYISDRVFYLGYTRKIRELHIGANVRHYYQKVTEYDSVDAFTLNVGAIWQNMMFTHGLSYSNVSHTTTKIIELPSLIKYEMLVAPFDKTNFAISMEKERHFDMRYGFGVSQHIGDSLVINSGFLNNPNQFSAGLVGKLNKIEIGYGVRTHTELSMTHAIGVRWALGD